jgi:hypothetical protein
MYENPGKPSAPSSAAYSRVVITAFFYAERLDDVCNGKCAKTAGERIVLSPAANDRAARDSRFADYVAHKLITKIRTSCSGPVEMDVTAIDKYVLPSCVF